jgi:peptidoglycan/LPS O-acetylase OafA/YrhL
LDPPDSAAGLRYTGYIPGLDVLRGVAILLVIVYHGTDGRVPWSTASSWWRWPLLAAHYGASGVQLFYVLSGFLITSILLDTKGSEEYYRKFYIRRALRILPAYLLLLVVLKIGDVVSWRFILAALLYIANSASLVGARSSEYGALWSLAVEEQFYLIWPFVVRKLSMRSLTRLILGYYVFDLMLRLAYLIFAPHADTAYKLWFNASTLLSGALIAVLLRRKLLRHDNIDRVIWTVGGLALLTIPAMIFLDMHPSQTLPIRLLSTLERLPYIFTYSALLLIALKYNRGAAPASERSFPTRFLAFFGYISYGLYLVHQFVFLKFDRLMQGRWLGSYMTNPWSLLANAAICIVISTALAYLSRRYFEDFFLKKKDKVVPYKDPAVNEARVSEPA